MIFCNVRQNIPPHVLLSLTLSFIIPSLSKEGHDIVYTTILLVIFVSQWCAYGRFDSGNTETEFLIPRPSSFYEYFSYRKMGGGEIFRNTNSSSQSFYLMKICSYKRQAYYTKTPVQF